MGMLILQLLLQRLLRIFLELLAPKYNQHHFIYKQYEPGRNSPLIPLLSTLMKNIM
jgi:hypothetical protein